MEQDFAVDGDELQFNDAYSSSEDENPLPDFFNENHDINDDPTRTPDHIKHILTNGKGAALFSVSTAAADTVFSLIFWKRSLIH